MRKAPISDIADYLEKNYPKIEIAYIFGSASSEK